jgi:hypothetical protein
MCAALYAAGLACSSSSPNLPPIEATGTTPGFSCEVGTACQSEGNYCIGAGQACKYLECHGGSWQCPPDGGFPGDAGPGAMDAADAPNAMDATEAAAESGKGDASGD